MRCRPPQVARSATCAAARRTIRAPPAKNTNRLPAAIRRARSDDAIRAGSTSAAAGSTSSTASDSGLFRRFPQPTARESRGRIRKSRAVRRASRPPSAAPPTPNPDAAGTSGPIGRRIRRRVPRRWERRPRLDLPSRARPILDTPGHRPRRNSVHASGASPRKRRVALSGRPAGSCSIDSTAVIFTPPPCVSPIPARVHQPLRSCLREGPRRRDNRPHIFDVALHLHFLTVWSLAAAPLPDGGRDSNRRSSLCCENCMTRSYVRPNPSIRTRSSSTRAISRFTRRWSSM